MVSEDFEEWKKDLVREELKAAKAKKEAEEAAKDAYQEMRKEAKVEERAAHEEEKAADADEKISRKRKPVTSEVEVKQPWHQREVRVPGAGLVSSALGSVGRTFGGVAKAAGSVGNHFSNHNMKYFLLLVVITHLVDTFSGYNHQSGLAVFWAGWYAIIALLFAPLMLSKDGFTTTYLHGKVFVYLGLSVAAYLMPVIISRLPSVITSSQWFVFLIVMTPVWVLYVFFAEGGDDEIVGKIRNGWLIIWVIILIALLVNSISTTHIPVELQGQFEFNPLDAVLEVWNTVWDYLSGFFSTVFGLGPKLGVFINRNLNDTLGKNYQGQVDPYSSRELGVEFSRLRAADSTFLEGGDVVVWADITGEAFRDEISLSLRCYAVDRNKNVIEGEIWAQGGRRPDELIFTTLQPTSARCTFTNLSKGYYTIHMAGTFNFETWSYIQYYFAPYELLNDLYLQDKDPAHEAGVDKRPLAIYNSGPGMLGLASETDQPIAVNPLRPDLLPPFGASLGNAWTDGKVSSVTGIILMVPEPFILLQCDRADVNGQKGSFEQPLRIAENPEVEGYREYRFDKINNPNLAFESVTCFLGFDGADEEARGLSANHLLGGYDLVMKTFGAKTKYLYTIEKELRVQVE